MRLVSRNEACKILGISRDTMNRYLAAGHFKIVDLSNSGTSHKVIRIDLASFLIQHNIDPTPYLQGMQNGLLNNLEEGNENAE